MNKKIFIGGAISLAVITASMSAFAYGFEDNFLDPFNNDIYEVVSRINSITKEEAAKRDDIIRTRLRWDEENIYRIRIYSDGSECEEKLISFAELSQICPVEINYMNIGSAYVADGLFPLYLKEENHDKYICTVTQYYENGSYTDYYFLIEDNNGVISKKVINTVYFHYDKATNDYGVYLNKAYHDAQNNLVEEGINAGPITREEYFAMLEYDGFDDGLDFKSPYTGDGDVISGYYDVNGEQMFMDPQFSYYTYGYNLGYLVEGYNNGGALDWTSEEDVEKDRRYSTDITNIFTNERYSFDNTEIPYFDDNGYAVMERKDDAGNIYKFLIRIKKPAIVTVFLNGLKIKFDQLPVIEDGRTLVPLRAIFEAIGAEVSWDGKTKTVTAVKDDTTVKLTVDSTQAVINGKNIQLDVPARIVNGRTLVPVRFIADSFDIKTDWDAAMKSVILKSN